MATTDVTTLVPLTAVQGYRGKSFQALRANIFPSEPSIRWFVRRHKAALVKAGALVMLRGRWHVDPSAWDSVLPRLLRADAEAALATGE
jgi:hypothetical protein